VIERLKKDNQDLFYGWLIFLFNEYGKLKIIIVCDPVMGDEGKLYVPQELVSFYKEKVIQFANVLLPNQTEAEILSDMKICNLDDAIFACDRLHSKGPQIVVITSFSIEISRIAELNPDADDDNFITVLCSDLTSKQRYLYQVKRHGGYYSGTGDLFAALFLSWYHKKQGNVDEAIKLTLGSLNEVIRSTFAAQSVELLVIQNRHELEFPKCIPKSKILAK
jgi:pyridoxine kinase